MSVDRRYRILFYFERVDAHNSGQTLLAIDNGAGISFGLFVEEGERRERERERRNGPSRLGDPEW